MDAPGEPDDPRGIQGLAQVLGLKQKDAAEKLGLKKRMIQYYETGNRGGKKVVIPKTVELACYALSVGIEAFDGNGRPLAASPSGRRPGVPGRSRFPL